MIKSLEVENLNGRISGSYIFNRDLNILTGENGSGKTTILKLLWYLISGNCDKIFAEMFFDYVKITTYDNSRILIETSKDFNNKLIARYEFIDQENIIYSKGNFFLNGFNGLPGEHPIVDSSVFLPTFRRIEGGFSVDSHKKRILRHKRNHLKEALNSISDNLSFDDNHRFVASYSTEDIINLLNEKYASISEQVRLLEKDQSREILKIVDSSVDKEKEALLNIRKLVKLNEKKISKILKPFTVLSDIITKIFKNKSIKIDSNLELGKAKNAISSNDLSSGEKQMLSFLCYNFFFDNSVIFIDEPELSLHTDWQRILFPTLLKQNKNNQFIIATHSPFIYYKYEDKEIILSSEKVDKNVQ